MVFYSPLRYPGGKRKLVNYFKELVMENYLLDGVYVEPYAGGASVALSLLIDGYVSKVIINDKDYSIYAFWYSILNNTEEFCNLIKKTPITIRAWKKQKEINENEIKDILKLGFSTFFLNRTNHSGILSAGPIGGFDQGGKWKINARYNKKDLIKRIRKIAEHKNKIEVHHYDAVDLIRELKGRLPQKTLFYFDPPYFVKGEELYLNHYTPEKHKQIAMEIFKIKGYKWVVTYDDVVQIREIYEKYDPKAYPLRYSVGNHNLGKEIIMHSKNIQIPLVFSLTYH